MRRPPTRQIIVAAKVPEVGRVKTRLIGEGLTPQTAAQFALAFLTDTLSVVQHPSLQAEVVLALDGPQEELPLPLQTMPIVPQVGNSLGERLVQLFATGFDAGREHIVIVGSDAPHLPVAFVQEAFGRLQAGADAVFGPADDGGYYLVGLRRPIPILFEGIAWSTETVLRDTLNIAATHGLNTVLLPLWHDIDTLTDLRQLARDLRRGTVVCPVTENEINRWLSRSVEESRLM